MPYNTDRRQFLELAAGAALSGVSTGPSAAPVSPAAPQPDQFTQPRTGAGMFERTSADKAPHIFLITADMVSPDLYHPDRKLSQHVKLPAVRSLMADGTFFSNAFCTVPLCAPSRASYLTGRYSYIQGNGERAPEGLETQLRRNDIIFPEYLRAAGYVARQDGKGHVGTQKFIDAFGENDNPWDRWSPPVFDDDGFLAYQRSLGVKPQRYSREIVFLQQDRRTPGNSAGGWIVQQNGKPFPIEAHYSYYLGKRAIDRLRSLVSTEVASKHPLYLQLDIFDPHQPFSIPAGFEEREKELRQVMSLPASYEAARKRDFARAADEPEILDIYRKYWGIYDPAILLDYRVAYALQMELVDRVIGFFLDEVKKLGLYGDAVVAFISDHGEMNGRRAMVDKGVYLYPDVLRVPFVVKPPKAMQKRGHVVHESVSLLDLSQTLLDFAHIRPMAKFDGVSLKNALTGLPLEKRGPLLFFGGWHVGVSFACGIEKRMPDGRHFVYAYNCGSPQDELYDLDAEDALNLISDLQYAQVRKSMIRELGAALASDPRWIGYWAQFRIARFGDLPRTEGDMQLFTKPT
jgi:arylsulfatase A-like enzyme